MSVAELKLAAIAEIGRLNDENAIREILAHLARFIKEDERPFDANAFFNRVAEKHDDVLKKLAQ